MRACLYKHSLFVFMKIGSYLGKWLAFPCLFSQCHTQQYVGNSKGIWNEQRYWVSARKTCFQKSALPGCVIPALELILELWGDLEDGRPHRDSQQWTRKWAPTPFTLSKSRCVVALCKQVKMSTYKSFIDPNVPDPDSCLFFESNFELGTRFPGSILIITQVCFILFGVTVLL